MAICFGNLLFREGRGITPTLKAMIKRRSAIEPTIGRMKMDGRLNRNPLKGALGDAVHAVLCGAGHKHPLAAQATADLRIRRGLLRQLAQPGMEN